MAMDIEAALLRAIAAPELADAIIGDLHERRAALAASLGEARALDACRSDVLRSIPSLVACSTMRAFIDNWLFALAAASLTCALCFATIPFWDHLGMGSGVYHILRLAAIGLALGCIPRASALSCFFLLLLIGVADWAIDPQRTLLFVLQDGTTIASMLLALHCARAIRTTLLHQRARG